MKIIFKDGSLKLSAKTKIPSITSVTVTQKEDKYSIYYHGVINGSGVGYRVSAKNVEFVGINFKEPFSGRNHWKDEDTGFYVNYYPLFQER